MRGVNFSGLWSLDTAFAMQMQRIIQPRLASGKDPLPTSYITTHPSAQLPADRPNVLAGSSSYYSYVADVYTSSGVCVIPIQGALSRYGLCAWGYEDLAGILQAAELSETVQAVLLKMDTPGGAVDGLKAAAEAIRAMTKPVNVWTNFCASAGYFLASQATQIWLEDQTLPTIGSIGTMMVYENRSKALEMQGLDIRIFRASGSTEKNLANGIEPLAPEVEADMQAMLDSAQTEFVGYVRRGRAGLLTSDQWSTGKMYGVRDGIKLGLADKVGSFQQAFKATVQAFKQSK
ncbi:S49 family peptidase [Spirosoma litoris]